MAKGAGRLEGQSTYLPVFQSFGELLKFLRRRQRLTQRDLALAVGYSEAHICRLEHNQRPPDLPTLLALFVPALELEHEPGWIARLLELATAARNEPLPREITLTRTTQQVVTEEVGVLEVPPPLPPYWVERPQRLLQLQTRLATERCLVLTGLAGTGKTRLAARLAQTYDPQAVFWLTFSIGEPPAITLIIRQLALFLLGCDQSIALALLQPSEPPIALQQQIAMLTAGLSQQPALLCFDHVQLSEPDPALGQLWSSLATTAEVLLISRSYVPLPGVAHLVLEGLDPGESCSLLHQLDPTAPTWLAPSQQAQLIMLTTGHPLLLRLALSQLHQAADPAWLEHVARDPQMITLIETLLQPIAPGLRSGLAWLAVFRQPVNVFDPAFIKLSQAADHGCSVVLVATELQRHHVIALPSRAVLPPLVRAYVLDQLLLDHRQRRHLHLRAAEWLCMINGDQAEIAYHQAQAAALAERCAS